MIPLSDDEAALCYHVTRFGSDGYPIVKYKTGRRWGVGDFRSVKGCPVLFKTKREAVAQFEAWHSLALLRWNETRQPGQIMTAVGIIQT